MIGPKALVPPGMSPPTSTLPVCAVQMEHGTSLKANLDRAGDLVRRAAADGARLVLLPEYWFAPPPPYDAAEAAVDARALLADLSAEVGCAVAGNVVEEHPDGDGLANVGLVFDAGEVVLEQVKVHPMPHEAETGIRPGDALSAPAVAGLGGRRVGMLVCSDVIYPEAARILALKGAEVLLNPVMSPHHAGDMTRDARESLYVARAYDAGAFVVKAGGFRPAPEEADAGKGSSDAEDRPGDVVGRSLVAAPWGLIARYADERAEELLDADLDLDRLRTFRERQQRFPPRRPRAYRDLVEDAREP